MPDDTVPKDEQTPSSQSPPTPSVSGSSLGFQSYPPGSTETTPMPEIPLASTQPPQEPASSGLSGAGAASEPVKESLQASSSSAGSHYIGGLMGELGSSQTPKLEEPSMPSAPPIPPFAPLGQTLTPPQASQEQSSSMSTAGGSPPTSGGTGGNFLSRLKRIFLVLAVLVILGVGGFFGYQTFLKDRLTGGGGEEATPSPGVSPGTSFIPQNPTPQPTPAAGIYQNSQHGFSIEPPSGWQEQQTPPEGVVVLFKNAQVDKDESGKDFNANINIVKGDLSQGQDLSQFFAKSKQELAALSEFKIVSEIKGTLSGSEAIQIDYTWKLSGTGLYQRQIYLLREKSVFILTATVTPSIWTKYQSVIEKSLGSFQFITQRS